MLIGLQAWAMISQLFYLPCLLPLALNAVGLLPDLWSPHTWSPYFGSSRVIFTHGVRGFWGAYWHQTMRWGVAGPGYALADGLKLGKQSMLRYTIIAVSAFGLSGVVHMGLVPPEPLHATLSTNAERLCVAGFFWLQPIAMVLEVLVASAVRASGGGGGPEYWRAGTGLRVRMATNGLWAVLWFTLCIPLLGEAGRQLGYWRVWPLPVSLWKGLRGEGWVVWPFLLE